MKKTRHELLPKRFRWLIITDLDGTLLKSGATHDTFKIHEENIKQLKEAVALGHKVAIVTGRPWSDTKKIYKAVGLTTIVGNYNGALIDHPSDEGFVPVRTTINRHIVKELLNEPEIKKAVRNIIVEDDSHPSIYDMKDKFMMDQFHILDNPQVRKMKTLDHIVRNPYSIVLSVDDSITKAIDVMTIAKRKWGNALALRFWVNEKAGSTRHYLEINSKAINKAVAMRKIAAYYNIPMNRTLAFGDGLNDIEMLSEAAYGVAMKNGSETVKTYANDVTDFTNDEGGVGHALAKFLKYDHIFENGDSSINKKTPTKKTKK